MVALPFSSTRRRAALPASLVNNPRGPFRGARRPPTTRVAAILRRGARAADRTGSPFLLIAAHIVVPEIDYHEICEPSETLRELSRIVRARVLPHFVLLTTARVQLINRGLCSLFVEVDGRWQEAVRCTTPEIGRRHGGID